VWYGRELIRGGSEMTIDVKLTPAEELDIRQIVLMAIRSGKPAPEVGKEITSALSNRYGGRRIESAARSFAVTIYRNNRPGDVEQSPK